MARWTDRRRGVDPAARASGSPGRSTEERPDRGAVPERLTFINCRERAPRQRAKASREPGGRILRLDWGRPSVGRLASNHSAKPGSGGFVAKKQLELRTN